MEELRELLSRLKDKLEYTRKLTDEYDHAMDFASHCTMQGLAEGIEFAIEEIEEMMRVAGPGSRVQSKRASKSAGRSVGKGKGRGAGIGRDEDKTKAKTKARPRLEEKRRTKERGKVKSKIGVTRKRRR